jgi:hypothetical protein
LRRLATRSAEGVAWLLGCAWLIGWLATDRWAWTQWLWWVHWGAWAGAAALAASIAFLATRSRFAWTVPAAIVAAGLLRDVGWRGHGALPPRGGEEIAIVHWNAGWPDSEAASGPSRRLLALEADLCLLSNPYRLFNDGRIEAWRAAGYDVVIPGLFAVASRLPVLEARTVFGSSDGAAAWFVLDASASLGRPLGVLVVDLPSDPRLHRGSLAGRMRSALDAAGFTERTGPAGVPVHLVVGDFNIPRGSASLGVIAPRHRHAWLDGGAGWGASWPRRSPWLHLDNALVGEELVARDYRLVDLGAGDHLAQRIRVRRGP